MTWVLVCHLFGLTVGDGTVLVFDLTAHESGYALNPQSPRALDAHEDFIATTRGFAPDHCRMEAVE